MLRAALVLALLVPSGLVACSGADAGTSESTPDASGSTADGASVADGPSSEVACGTDPTRLDLGDVTFFYPLPEVDADVAALIALDAVGAGGALLPARVLDVTLPLSRFESPPPGEVRVVAIRFDPCVPGGADADDCRPQLRLVAQPMVTFAGQPPTTIDAAIHLFYDLDPAALERVTAAVLALKTIAGDTTFCQPLGPNPVLRAQGLRGAYATALAEMVLAECGETTLTRAAVMQLSRSGSTWTFATVDVTPSAVTPFEIPLLGDATQQSITVSDTTTGEAHLGPEPAEGRLPLLLAPDWLAAAADADVRLALAESLAIEDPTEEHAGTRDCVSCHISHRARASALALRPLDLVATAASMPYDLTVLEATDVGLGSQRMLGYFGREPSLSPRVVRESADIAAFLGE